MIDVHSARLSMRDAEPHSVNPDLPNGHEAANGSRTGPQVQDASTLESLARIRAQLSEISAEERSESDRLAEEREALPRSSLSTGVCYDARMRFHTELVPSKDRTEYHPEDPRRIYYIYRALCEAGLVEDKMSIPPMARHLLRHIPARHAERDEVCLVHTQEHFDYLRQTQCMFSGCGRRVATDAGSPKQ